MLQRCLESLAGQVIDKGIELEIIVVDNEPERNNRAVVVADYHNQWIFHYRHQPKRGIAAARNAALDAAMELGADWIAFIDDDEVAAPDWIAQLMASEYLDTPVLLGRQVVEYPIRRPFWCVQGETREQAEGRSLRTGWTNNVRLSAELVRMGLHFNEELGLIGGEDQEMFAAAHRAGFAIRQTQRAITVETAHPERLTYRGQIARAYWCAASDLRRLAIEKARRRAVLRRLHTVPFSMVFGAVELAVSPLFVVGGLKAFKRRALAGGKKIAKGAGRAAAMIGRLPQPYLNVAGH
jgi:succinoglycan biosynthesis protein ExoM